VLVLSLNSNSNPTYNAHVSEPCIEITSAASKIRNRRAPVPRIGIAAPNIPRNVATRKVPYFDAVAGPQACVHTTAICIERGTIRGWTIGHDTAAVVPAASAAVGVGDAAPSFAPWADRWCASRGGVERNLVLGIEVDAFVDVWAVC
jgi:hypothetical protein